MTTYVPTEGTIAARALDAIEMLSRGRPAGAWVPNIDVCRRLEVLPNAVRPSLDRAIEVGLVEYSHDSSKRMQWRLPLARSRRKPKVATPPAPARQFGIDWPPGFVSQFDTVKVASYEERRK